MIKFIKTELKDITEFKKYLPQNDAVSCDGTVGGIFMWFDEFNTYHAVINDTLIQKITVSGEDMFAPPYGKDVTGAVFEIYSYCIFLHKKFFYLFFGKVKYFVSIYFLLSK